MKSLIILIVAFIIGMFFVPQTQTFAQAADTVWVNTMPIGNINDFINGDTTSSGARVNPNRVYKLHRDSIYFYTGYINANFKLTLIAGDGNGPMPVIAPAILENGSSPAIFIILAKGGLTLKNLYLFGIRPDEKPAPGGRVVWTTGDSMKIYVDHCIFDGWNFGAIFNHGIWNSYWITNNKFRNMMDYRSWFWGDSFFSYGAPYSTDTLYIVNNTIFNCEGYAFVSVYYNHYTLFDHNTVFLNGINPMYSFNLTNAKITNNIFYGMVAQGQRHVEIDGGWFENNGQMAAVFTLDTLRRVAADLGIKEDQRYVNLDNNAYFWPQGILNNWKTINDTASSADSVFLPVWLNQRTIKMFTDKNTWPHLEASNNLNVDPGFNTALADTTVGSLTHYVFLNRSGQLGTYLWWYNPTGHVYPPTQPIPENLKYSNTSLQHAGTDGKALGDLNWFPDQLVAVDETSDLIPTRFELSQNYPNPFNPTTQINYSVPQSSFITLKVYNVLGQEVATLFSGVQTAGKHIATFDASKYSSGVYFYRLQSGNFISVKKMMLLK